MAASKAPTRTTKVLLPSGPYVYALLDHLGAPFYIGKGRRDRMFQHARQAMRGHLGPKCEKIREIVEAGESVGYSILGEYSTDYEAASAEKSFIAAHSGLTNRTKGGEVGGRGDVKEWIRRRAARTLASIAPLDVWAASLSAANHELISRIFGSPESLYFDLVDNLIAEIIDPSPTVIYCDSNGTTVLGWERP